MYIQMSLEPLVPLKNSLKQSAKFQTISDKIVENLKVIPELDSHKHSVELVQYVCNLIELYVKGKYKINKENLLIFTLNRLISLNEEDTLFIKQTIQYLLDNKLVKKATVLKKGFEFAKGFVKKRII